MPKPPDEVAQSADVMRLRSGIIPRCSACALHVPLCLCGTMKPIDTRTRCTLLMHAKESRRSTNTGHLLPLGIRHCQIRIRGRQDTPGMQQGLHRQGHYDCVLFPSEDATVLTAEWVDSLEMPVHLIVPDGNWRQAKKMIWREPELANLPRVTIQGGALSRYRLRRHQNPRFLSTFEAVSRALDILESDTISTQIQPLFDTFVDRSLWARGDLSTADVAGGVPPEALKPFLRVE